jgi:hypothetical protein
VRFAECARLIVAFGTLLTLSLGLRALTLAIGPEVPAVIAVLMSLGALPALMLHWVRPTCPGRPTLIAATLLTLPGLGLALQLWHDWLVTQGVTPNAPLVGVALALALVQAVALRASRQTRMTALAAQA